MNIDLPMCAISLGAVCRNHFPPAAFSRSFHLAVACPTLYLSSMVSFQEHVFPICYRYFDIKTHCHFGMFILRAMSVILEWPLETEESLSEKFITGHASEKLFICGLAILSVSTSQLRKSYIIHRSTGRTYWLKTFVFRNCGMSNILTKRTLMKCQPVYTNYKFTTGLLWNTLE